MGRLGAAGRKRDSGVVLVLEHRWKRPHVLLLHFPAGSGWHSGLSPKLAYLHSQSDAYPETKVRPDSSRTFATPTRNRLTMDPANILE
jgi:hypothetical protein